MQGVQSSIQSLINYNSLKYKRPFTFRLALITFLWFISLTLSEIYSD